MYIMTDNHTFFKTKNHVVDEQELLNRAYRVRISTGDSYINHQNGLFFTVKGDHSMSLHAIYPLVTSAWTLNRRLFAKRKKLNRPLLAGVVKKQ